MTSMKEDVGALKAAGNTLFHDGDLVGAVEAFRRALLVLNQVSSIVGV